MGGAIHYYNFTRCSEFAQWVRRGFNTQFVSILIIAILSFLSPFSANAVQNPDFNHFTTGFPLSGKHLKVDCELCHINGVFKGTPKTCSGCHNGRSASGKDSNHIASTNTCDDCHTTFTWDRAAVDHNSVKGDCKYCHNKLPPGHLQTSRVCDDCHGTIAWAPARFDHTNVTAGCITCHSKDKSANHVPTTADCGFCHGTVHWTPAHFNHVTITDPCTTCHANDKPSDHIPTTEECGVCHSTEAWLPVLQTATSAGAVSALSGETANVGLKSLPSTGTSPSTNVDHNTVAPGSCNRCHIGDKPMGHIATTRSCDDCHNTRTWSGANFDHNNAAGQCISCHANDKPSNHLRTRAQCSDCHNVNTWNSADFDHSNVVSNCVRCHNGTTARSKPNNHPSTNNLCENCHNIRSWTPVRFDHASTAARCFTCHKKPPQHPRTGNMCDDCHRTTNWSTVRFDHGSVTRTCETCHNKPTNHPLTTKQCSECHTTTNWQRVTYKHNSGNYPGDHRRDVTCLSCHGRNLQKARWKSPAFAPDCAGCHARSYRPKAHIKYGRVMYTVNELRDCAGPCHEYTDSSLSQISRHRNGGQHRTNSGGFN